MIWRPLTTLQAVFSKPERQELGRKARRWRQAAEADSRLVIDLIELGGVLTGQPARLVEGYPSPDLPDPQTLAYAAGRRDMALQILALMNLTPTQTQALMKEAQYDAE